MQFHKSKIINKSPIDWDETIHISELRMDPNLLKAHTDRVNTVFAHLSEQERRQQIQNIVVRDNIFNIAMEYIDKFYEIEFDREELNNLIIQLTNNLPKEYAQFIPEIAKKAIKKDLIFNDIAQEYGIEISNEELINILNQYYSQTKQPIKDFMKDANKFEAAKKTLLEEKITAFIVDKFPKDLSELEAKLYASLKEQEMASKKVDDQIKQDVSESTSNKEDEIIDVEVIGKKEESKESTEEGK